MRSVLVVLIAVHAIACGRIGFDAGESTDAGGDGSIVPPDRITISVRGAPDDPGQGLPVAGATVMLAGPSSDATYATDAAGFLEALVDGPTTIHIGYRVDGTGPWRLYTLTDVPGGTAVTIGHTIPSSIVAMNVILPSLPNANRYQLHGPQRCGINGVSGTTTVPTAVNGCLGDTIPIYAVAYDNLTALGWLEAGAYVAAETTYTASGTWQPVVTQTIRYANLPDSLLASAELARVVGPADRVVVGTGSIPATAQNPEQMIGALGAAVDVVYVTYTDQTTDPRPTALLADPAPPPIAGARTIDSTRFADLVTAPVADTTGMSWSIAPLSRALVAVFVEIEYVTLGGVDARWIFTGTPRMRVDVPVLAPPLEEIAATPGTMEGFVVGLVFGGPTYDEVAGQIIDSLLGFSFLPEMPLGWVVSVVQTVGGTKRAAPSSRLVHQLRAVTGAD